MDTKRSWQSLFKQGLETNYDSLSYFSGNTINLSTINFGGQGDDRTNYLRLSQIAFHNPVCAGIYQKISQVFDILGWRMKEITKNGVKETRASKEYARFLKSTNIDKIIKNLLIANYGSGLGNALIYKVKNRGKIEYKADPFIMNGIQRVKVFQDRNLENMEIQRYEICDVNDRAIYTFEPKQVYHHKFMDYNGNPAFGSNPVIHLSKILSLYDNIMSIQEAMFKNGMKSSFAISLDMEKMVKQGTSAEGIKGAEKALIEQLREARGIQNSGTSLYLPGATTITPIQLNNSQMRVPELLPLLEDLIHKGYGVDKAVLDTSLSKYDNVDKAMDQLYQNTIKAPIIQFQKLVNSWLLPDYDPEFDESRFMWTIPRQFSQEEIRIKELNDKAMSMYFGNLKTANESLSQYNLAVLPTEEKLKFLEEQGMYVKTTGKEPISIKATDDTQTDDYFTQITGAETVNRQRQTDFWLETESWLDKSFSQSYATRN